MPRIQLPLTNACLKADGTTQPTPGCTCPLIKLLWHTVVRYCEHVGWKCIIPGSPDTFFRHYSVSGPGIGYSMTDNTTFAVVSSDFATPGLTTTPSWGWNATTGAEENTGAADYSDAAGPSTGRLGDNLCPASTGRFLNDGDYFQCFNIGVAAEILPTFSFNSATSMRLQGNGASYVQPPSGPGAHSYTHRVDTGYIDIDLTDEDTHANALTRSLAGIPLADAYNEYDSSATADGTTGELDYAATAFNEALDNTDGYRFLYATTKFACLLDNLVAGAPYRLTLFVVRRTAQASAGLDDSNYGADWESLTPIVVDFVADGPQYLHGGSWSDANSDDIITDDEVTPETDLTADAGYEVAIFKATCEMLFS